MPPECLFTADRHRERLLLPHHYDEPLPARHPGIDQIPLQHHVVLHRDREHHNRVLTPLGLMNRGRVAEHEFVEFPVGIDDVTPVKIHGQFFLFGVKARHKPDVAIKHIAVIVILDLHHFVANGKGRPELLDLPQAG